MPDENNIWEREATATEALTKAEAVVFTPEKILGGAEVHDYLKGVFAVEVHHLRFKLI